MPFLSKFRIPFASDVLFGVQLLLILTVPFAFSLFTYEKFEAIKLGFWAFWVGIGLCVLFIRMWRQSQQVSLPKVLLVLVSLFFLWSLLSTVFSLDVRNSVWGFYPRFTSGLLFFLLWSLTIFIFCVGYEKEKFLFLSKVLIFDSLVVAVVGIFQSTGLGFYEGVGQSVIARAPGLLGNADFTSMFLAAMVPLSLVLCIRAVKQGDRWYYACTTLLSIGCIAMLTSRGAILALLVGLVSVSLLLLKIDKRRLWLGLAGVVIAIILCGGIAYAIRPQIVSFHQSTEQNVSQRLFVWDLARMAIIKHPIFGAGLGNFQIMFQQLRGKNLANLPGVFDDAHNLFLQIAVTGGIPSALLFIILIGFSVWTGTKAALREQDSLMAGFVCGLLALSFAACFTPVSTACFLLFAIFFIGCCASNFRSAVMPQSKIWAIPALILGIAFAVFGVTFLIGEHVFFKGYNQYYAGNFKSSLRLLHIVGVIDPVNPITPLYVTANKLFLENNRQVFFDETARFVASHPQDARSYVAAANVYYTAFQISQNKLYARIAIADMNAALGMDPFYAKRYGYTAYYYFLVGDTVHSLGYAKYGLSLDPSDLPSWLLLAKIYQQDNKKEQMVFALQQAQKLQPSGDLIGKLLTALTSTSNIQSIPIPIGLLPTSLE